MKLSFSIVIPTFNRGYVIWKTIQSVQKQIYPNWELLIVDDGSTDNTRQIVAEFQKDPRIVYFYKNHEGACIARNVGLKKSKGEFVVYLDSDDYFYENYLSTVLEYFQKNPKKIFAVSNYNRRVELYNSEFKLLDFTKASSSQKEEIKLQDFYYWNVRTTSSGLVHRKNISKKIAWDPKVKRFQDWDFIMQLGNLYPHGFLHIPQVLFEYSQKHGTNSIVSDSTYEDWAKAFELIYKKHKSDPLMRGQTWFPRKVEKHRKLQKEFEEGKAPPFKFKNFPKYFRRSK